MKTKLTATATSSLRRCPRQHYLRFELGLSRIRKATPLRFGGAKAFSRAWARLSPAVSLSPTPSSTYARPALMPVVFATDQSS